MRIKVSEIGIIAVLIIPSISAMENPIMKEAEEKIVKITTLHELQLFQKNSNVASDLKGLEEGTYQPTKVELHPSVFAQFLKLVPHNLLKNIDEKSIKKALEHLVSQDPERYQKLTHKLLYPDPMHTLRAVTEMTSHDIKPSDPAPVPGPVPTPAPNPITPELIAEVLQLLNEGLQSTNMQQKWALIITSILTLGGAAVSSYLGSACSK